MRFFWGKDVEPAADQPGSDPEKAPKQEPFPKPAIPVTPNTPRREEPPREPDQPDEPRPQEEPTREPEEAPAG